jgi:hypothetical protein
MFIQLPEELNIDINRLVYTQERDEGLDSLNTLLHLSQVIRTEIRNLVMADPVLWRVLYIRQLTSGSSIYADLPALLTSISVPTSKLVRNINLSRIPTPYSTVMDILKRFVMWKPFQSDYVEE